VDADELPGKPPPSMEEVAVAGRVVGAAIDPLPRPRARGSGGSPTPRGLGPREWDGGVERSPRPNRRPAAPPPSRPRVRPGATAVASMAGDTFFLCTAPSVDIPPHCAGEEGETGEKRACDSNGWRPAAPHWGTRGSRTGRGRGGGGAREGELVGRERSAGGQHGFGGEGVERGICRRRC
jgi:hypothetical protein